LVTSGIQGEAAFASGPQYPTLPMSSFGVRALRGHCVFLACPSHDNLQCVVRQGPLKNLCLIPRRTHPHIALLLRMLVTGGPPVRGGGGMPQRMVTSSVPLSVLRITGAG
jgi:hypothetical protein